MEKQIPIITYIINGKEETKKINIFNFYKVRNKLFESNIFDLYTLSIKSNVEFVRFSNITFRCSKFYINPNSKIVFDNCIFNNCLLNLCKNEDKFCFENDNSKVEILNPYTSKYLGIRSESLKDLSIVLDRKITYKLTISGNVDKFSLKGDLNGGDIRLDTRNAYFNGVSNILSLSLNPIRTIMPNDSVTINDSKVLLKNQGYFIFDQINTSNLNLNNTVIFKEKSGDEICEMRIKVNNLSGTNFTIKVPNDIEIREDIYKKKKTEKYLLLTDKYFQNKKNQLIRNFSSILKGIIENIENIYINSETKCIQEKYAKEILRQQVEIEKTKKKSQNEVKKLERKLKRKNIGSYYQK